MTRRGRPPHPDVLTPREWEVLDLVREGLANEQIAQRLGISVGGVKYHVSEILGKLGLDNRADAARWQPGQARRWWAVLGAPLAWRPRLSVLSGALAGGLALAVAAGIGVLVWSLAATDSAPGQDAPASVAEAYELMLAAADRPGSVLHTTIRNENRGKSDAVTNRLYTKDLWIDADDEILREEFHKDPAWDADLDDETMAIYAGGYAYLPDGPGEAIRSEVEEFCPGSDSVVIARLLECGGLTFHQLGPAGELEFDTQYEGHDAFAIVSTQVGEGETDAGTPIPALTRSSLYVDSQELLPLGYVAELYLNDELEITFTATYEHEFVPPESLPEAFFDPRSIGYGAEDPSPHLDLIAQDVPVYWFGEEQDPSGGTGPIGLANVYPVDSAGARRMYYETPDSAGTLDVVLWTPEEWDASPIKHFLSDASCVERSELVVGDRTASTYVLPYQPPSVDPGERDACEREAYELRLSEYARIAVLEFEGVVVELRPHGLGTYDSLPALEALLAELRPR